MTLRGIALLLLAAGVLGGARQLYSSYRAWEAAGGHLDTSAGDLGTGQWQSLGNGQAIADRSDYLEQYDPATGKRTLLEVPEGAFGGRAVVAWGDGLLIAGGEKVLLERPAVSLSDAVHFVRPGRSPLKGRLHQARRDATATVLPDRSVLIAGGIIGYRRDVSREWFSLRTNALDRVTIDDDRIKVEPLPDIPGPPRRGMTLVALPGGQIMALGGTASDFLGCHGCLAETYLLDLGRREWRPGPPMTKPRAYPSATLLPDGRVLVAGGWTPDADWSEGGGPSASTEWWAPDSERFEPGPPMPSGNAGHSAEWLPGAYGRRLLTGGGASPLFCVLDVQHNVWRVAGETLDPAMPGAVIPYGIGSGEWIGVLSAASSSAPLRRILLRLPWRPLVSITGEMEGRSAKPITVAAHESGPPTRALYRSRMATSAWTYASAGGFMVLAGGALPESRPNGILSGAVDMVDERGQLRALPALPIPRHGGELFVYGDSLFLVGGSNNGRSNEEDSELPLEWLPDWRAASSRWQTSAIRFSAQARFALDPSAAGRGSLVVLEPDGSLARVRLGGVTANGSEQPRLDREALPALPYARRDAVLRVFTDGTMIAAGGEVQRNRIEVMDESGDGPVSSVGFGNFSPWPHYDIFDPTTGRWRESAAPSRPGGPTVILDDGRVVKLSTEPVAEDAIPTNFFLEISSAGGRAWYPLKAVLPEGLSLDGNSRLIATGGELFLLLQAVKGQEHEPVLLWLRDLPSDGAVISGAAGQWTEVWRSPQGLNWRDHVGRLILCPTRDQKKVAVLI